MSDMFERRPTEEQQPATPGELLERLSALAAELAAHPDALDDQRAMGTGVLAALGVESPRPALHVDRFGTHEEPIPSSEKITQRRNFLDRSVDDLLAGVAESSRVQTPARSGLGRAGIVSARDVLVAGGHYLQTVNEVGPRAVKALGDAISSGVGLELSEGPLHPREAAWYCGSLSDVNIAAIVPPKDRVGMYATRVRLTGVDEAEEWAPVTVQDILDCEQRSGRMAQADDPAFERLRRSAVRLSPVAGAFAIRFAAAQEELRANRAV